MNEPIKKIDDGGPAFPQDDATVNRINGAGGMSLRDYFAAKALQGYLSNPTVLPPEKQIQDSTNPQDMANVAALFAYMVADAMLADRKEKYTNE